MDLQHKSSGASTAISQQFRWPKRGHTVLPSRESEGLSGSICIGKSIADTGFGTIHGFWHLLEVLKHIPHKEDILCRVLHFQTVLFLISLTHYAN